MVASRRLLNFNSFDEFLVYVGIFFSELSLDMCLLRKKGAEYVGKRKGLILFEQCLMCHDVIEE